MESKGRVILVTGGSRGIGRAIALKLAGSGDTLLINHYDKDDEAARVTASEVEHLGAKAYVYFFSVANAEEVDRYVGEMIEAFGRIDVLVNNAGITMDSLFVRMKEEQWDLVIDVNLKGVFNCSKAVGRAMMKQRQGKIVNIASVVGAIGNVGQANYAASKAGIMGFTKTIAKELAGRNINVNAVAPGFIDTEMTANLPEKAKQAFLESIPMGRMGSPEEVADLVEFLCSDRSKYITGQIIHVNGGLY
ncbi:MAG: 3-oxoacyl-[acyl-carrier-protein] reductase [Deltaproteobacteria bacterium]|nr:3-oxoacyl-[acyl-carrier-protein] reductase [Deltaproteobacteria bacterium]